MQPKNLVPLKRALVSVSDRTHLETLVRHLQMLNVEIWGTTSSAAYIQSLGIPCGRVEELTQFPEMLGGRVKTLHPAVFGGILAQMDKESDLEDLKKFNLKNFDLVVCNLYPFQDAVKAKAEFFHLVEKIDIGGVSLLRAAAKNHRHVSILCDAEDYESFIASTQESKATTEQQRQALAVKAFQETSAYDGVISATLAARAGIATKPGPIAQKLLPTTENQTPEVIQLTLTQKQSLRYGENPHQCASFYTYPSHKGATLSQMRAFHGKELSYNNMLDIEHGLRLISEFEEPTAVIVKHNVACGVATDTQSVAAAYEKAFAGDTVSPFGGIVFLNREVDEVLAQKLSEVFLEVVLAPKFSDEALLILQKKKNLRLVELEVKEGLANNFTLNHVQGGFLLQDYDALLWDEEKVVVPTKIKPPKEIMKSAKFAFTVCKHLRSNAIAITNDSQTVAVAGGFTNRVDAVKSCLAKATLPLDGCLLASDAFFPFPDSIELLKGTGIKYIVQPGGSVQDDAVIAACDALEIGMIFTGMRHFKH